ncbi:response regulator [Chryseolinea sp. H1M3-3]|uniref:response regulator n=1 Tax=Chryseolinea sp. H1M3-3 TaxID=3034144 RepID=UPI0023EDBA89|nr:response regulator [Chryseolinea sp. H1M3-3]
MTHILIIDDDEDDRELLTIAIHEVDPSIHCAMARNGEEALHGLKVMEFPKPHVIFLDLNMPRLNGDQFMNELRKDRELHDIPVVIYTTSKLKEDAEKMRALGASDFLTKPTSFNELCRSVKEILAKVTTHS